MRTFSLPYTVAAGVVVLLALVLGTGAMGAESAKTADAGSSVVVVIGKDAPKLEQFAAAELCKYLKSLYGIDVGPATAAPKTGAGTLLLVGSAETNAAVRAALGAGGWPSVSDQGIVLKRAEVDGKPALVVGGGSPRATLWAVYELAERWGVRYLIHGDVLPKTPGAFRVPEQDAVMEPVLRARQWRVINDFANGSEGWGIADYRPVLDQLAKLKFNRLMLYTWPYQPYIDLKYKGIERKWGTLWWNNRLPIRSDTIGREVFGDAKEFWNPDLPDSSDYPKFAAAGQRLLQNVIDHAHERGMECNIAVALTDFPPEFAPLLKNPQKIHQLNELSIVPGPETPIDDPATSELSAAVLKTALSTYSGLDYVFLAMPEHRQWVAQYEQAWKALDAKYGISKVRSLDEVLAAARQRKDYPGGPDRAVMEVKGDLVSLYFFDHIINDLHAVKDTRNPNVKFIYATGAEEIYPLLSRIVPGGSETLSFVDYTPARVVRRRGVLKNIPCEDVPASLIFTIEDDNIGLFPQLTTGSLAELTKDIVSYGWAGFSPRCWLIGDKDPCVAYLAEASWHRDATPESVDRDQVRAVCGPQCVDDMLEVFREVEAVTVSLEWHNLSILFPVPGIIMHQWRAAPMSAELVANRKGYQKALDAARRARVKCDKAGLGYVDYWIGRLEFAVNLLDAIDALHRAAMAEHEKDRPRAIRHAEEALGLAKRAIEAHVGITRDQCDRGAIAQLNEYVYRPIKVKLGELKKQAAQ